MTKRKWFRNQLKKELKGIRGTTKRVLRRTGLKVTLHNQVMLSLGMYSELR